MELGNENLVTTSGDQLKRQKALQEKKTFQLQTS